LLLDRIFGRPRLFFDEFLFLGRHFGGTSLIVNLFRLPVMRNGGW
jgi:hypothetical protein